MKGSQSMKPIIPLNQQNNNININKINGSQSMKPITPLNQQIPQNQQNYLSLNSNIINLQPNPVSPKKKQSSKQPISLMNNQQVEKKKDMK